MNNSTTNGAFLHPDQPDTPAEQERFEMLPEDKLPEPYYRDDHVTLYHADNRDIVAALDAEIDQALESIGRSAPRR